MLKGEKISLRPITKKDLPYLNKWKNDEEVYRYLGGGFMPTSIDLQEKWLESMMDLSGNNKRFIINQLDSSPVGMIGLYDINWIHRTCEVGLYIGEKNAQGKGYAKESYHLLEKFAKEYLNLRKINLKVVYSNDAAAKFWESVGYRKVGILKEERFIKGTYLDLMIMEKFI